jgi:hypothetical protein
LPLWDTHRSFGSPTVQVGRIGSLELSGFYRYYATPGRGNQELLVLNLQVDRVVFKALGWVLRRLFCIKDNYFGGYTQYKQASEFTENFKPEDPDSTGESTEAKLKKVGHTRSS